MVSAVCLCTSTSLKRFNLPLLRYLSRHVSTVQWEYEQEFDEPNSFDSAVELLAGYLRAIAEPVHLIGHGISGVLGLMFTRSYPELVRSLTLLSVAAGSLGTSWQSQYYAHRQFLHCDRHTLLVQIAYHLFGYRDPDILERLALLLQNDLDYSLCPHSLFQQMAISPVACPCPMMVCGSADDIILGKVVLADWQSHLKLGDRYKLFNTGRHFFHYFNAQEVGREISDFWTALSPAKSALLMPNFK